MIDALTMTAAKPTMPGYYWVCCDKGSHTTPQIREFAINRFLFDGMLEPVDGPYSTSGWDWFLGPLVIPKVPSRGFCWCDMCGLNKKVKPEDMQPEDAQIDCPDCESVGQMSFLNFGAELPEHVAKDEPMRTYRPRKKKL